jgi:hypothetical protein
MLSRVREDLMKVTEPTMVIGSRRPRMPPSTNWDRRDRLDLTLGWLNRKHSSILNFIPSLKLTFFEEKHNTL